MKVLIIASCKKNSFAPFVVEQVDSIVKKGVIVDFLGIDNGGFWGYLKHYKKLKNKINEFKPDIIHAHYGLSGLFANLQRRIPTVTTFHGSDINITRLNIINIITIFLSKYNIFVSEELYQKSIYKSLKSSIIPCGVDIDFFKPIDKNSLIEKWKFDSQKIYILFSSAFTNTIKNYTLASQALEHIDNKKIILLELSGYSRIEVLELINTVDLVLLTSISEGSPQFIKEAMACNKPIVSTNVGNIKWLFGHEEGHFLTTFESKDVASNILKAIHYCKQYGLTKGRNRIISQGLDLENTAQKILNIYNRVLISK